METFERNIVYWILPKSLDSIQIYITTNVLNYFQAEWRLAILLSPSLQTALYRGTFRHTGSARRSQTRKTFSSSGSLSPGVLASVDFSYKGPNCYLPRLIRTLSQYTHNMSDLSEKFSQRVESGRDELGEPSQPSGHLNLGTSSGNSDHTKEFSDSARKSLREDEFYSGYTWNGFTGWKRFRLLRPGRGIYYDIRRRLPYYLSDITDGFSYRTFASCIRMYFVK